jgi:hypothetical protein
VSENETLTSEVTTMHFPLKSLFCFAALWVAWPAHADTNSFIVTVDNGPLHGTYHLPVAEVSCLHWVKRRVYSSGWKDFKPANPSALAEAGIEVQNPDVPGPKFGTVLLTFGDSDKAATHYAISHAPLTLSVTGSHGQIVVRGKTKEGVQVQVTVSCLDTMEID